MAACDVPELGLKQPPLKQKKPPISRMHLLVVMVGLVLLGACNFVLVKVMYTAYGARRSFFVNQAINLLYIGYGAIMLYPRMLCTDHITADMTRFPKRHFFTMGFLDSLGTFFTCLGAAYTPGSLTPLLNQLLIPFTMLVSARFLRRRYVRGEIAGAALIVAGACLSVLPSLIASHADGGVSTQIRWYAVLFYACSNLPMAMSACYKESKFEEVKLDVWYLTQWVSIFQFLVSFLYMPLLVLPGFGSPTGMTWQEVPVDFMDGWHCYMEHIPECADRGTFLLLTGYCGVNVCFNTLGLYLTKHGTAVLNSLSFSILLPLTAALFFTPLLGPFQEAFTTTSYFTLVGLVITLMGFGLYQKFSKGIGISTPNLEGQQPPTAQLTASLLDGFAAQSPRSPKGQPSFQERVIGMGHAAGRYSKSITL